MAHHKVDVVEYFYPTPRKRENDMRIWLLAGGCAAMLALTGCPTENNDSGDAGTTGDDMSMADMGETSDMSEATLLYIAKVESTTTAVDGCAVEDPGPDIFGVGLEDGLGEQLGWGSVVWEEIQTDANSHADTSILDGTPLDLAADACPDMFDGNVVALGCEETGNWLALEFLDAESNRVPLDATQDQWIRVYEWGGQCTTGSLDDTYTLTLCTDTAAITAGDDESCTIQLVVDGAGENPGEVAGF